MSSLPDASRRAFRRPRHWVAVASAALLATLLLATSAGAEDSALAKFLLEGGRKDLEKKQYDDALTKLEKAAVEDPKLLEARYWIAVANERKGDVPKAVAAYRAFRDACAAATPPPDKELAKLLKATEARLTVLAAAEVELQKLNEAFVAKALAFAKGNYVRDPVLATRALQDVLLLAPGHAEATALLEKLTGLGTTKKSNPDGGPYKDVAQWDDFLRTKFLGTNAGWEYTEDLLKIDKKGGSFVWPRREYTAPKAYVVELEAQIVEAYPSKSCFGIGFGKKGEDSWYALHLGKTEVVLWRVDGPSHKDLLTITREPLEIGTWNRLALVVDGLKLEGFLNDKKVLSFEVTDRDNLGGPIGIWYQDSRFEIRRFRAGARG
jgi:tetratricopeptide (TPR) repeat protein